MATKNRRTKFLINPKFQLSFLKSLVFLNLTICGVFYAAHAYFFWQGREVGQNLELPADHVFFRFIDEQQRALNLISLATMSVVLGVIVFFGLVYSHKIAGPVYRIQKYLRERAAGTEKGKLHFRDGDYFPEVAESINAYLSSSDVKPTKASSKKVA